ncbi:MAG: hypothetical protein JSW00_15620 [Thermoplasmata archaeon]|nr:MAG: hypothetical protein JSW00_15620 [Thermoplasmata archaeon]
MLLKETYINGEYFHPGKEASQMKLIDVCRGCGARRLVNHLKLCKRCNKQASQFLSKQDIEQARLEREALLEAKAKMKEAEELAKAEAAAAAMAAAEAEGEGEEEKEGEKPKEGEKEGEKKKPEDKGEKKDKE